MTIEMVVRKPDCQTPTVTVLGKAINKARVIDPLIHPSPEIKDSQSRYVCVSPDLVIGETQVQIGNSVVRRSRVYIKDEITGISVTSEKGTIRTLRWRRTPDNRGKLAHCIDRLKDIKASIAT